MGKMINDDFVKYENSKNDEYIRLDTTIIGIDNLIAKASTAEEANVLFKAKDVIYSQQKHFIYRQPVKYDTELSSVLQDYGIKNTDTLRYILDQYQKIIVDITGGQMSYLTYPAEIVIACADDNYRKCHEESMVHGQWIEEHTNQIQWLPNENESYNAQDTSLTERRCSNCKLWSVDFSSRIIMNFCPNCGSYMKDGDSE